MAHVGKKCTFQLIAFFCFIPGINQFLFCNFMLMDALANSHYPVRDIRYTSQIDGLYLKPLPCAVSAFQPIGESVFI